MSVAIQRIIRPGAGAKLYPDAAMDAGTLTCIDLLRSWCWGSVIPASGTTVTAGATVKNLALAEDGASGDDGAVMDAVSFQYGGLLFDGSGKRLRLPPDAYPAPGDRDRGWIIWLSHTTPSAPGDWVNSFFSIIGGAGVVQLNLDPVYSGGTLDHFEMILNGTSGQWVLPTVIRTAMLDGLPHQLGLQIERSSDLTLARRSAYLDGAAVGSSGWQACSANWLIAENSNDLCIVGRATYWNGSGINGVVRRVLAHDSTISGAGSFSALVVRDYTLNYARLLAAAAVA